jgi:hypothetical protein
MATPPSLSSSSLDLFDNVAWVRENAQNLSPHNIDTTFRQILQSHPLRGCAFRVPLPMASLSTTASLAELAKYADAVTVCCYEACGAMAISVNAQQLVQSGNTTAIGNLAFIGLHHSDATVRTQTIALLDAWRQAMMNAVASK